MAVIAPGASAAAAPSIGVPPMVMAVLGSSGPASGGSLVILFGMSFTGTTAVHFGATAATGITVNSDTTMVVTAPAGTGIVDITVTTASGTSSPSPATQFTYLGPPAVTGLTSTSGPVSGGGTVVITGSGFTGASSVDFGPNPVTSYSVDSDTTITAVAPAGSAGTVDVTVTTIDGTSTTSSADEYTYVAPPPPAAPAVTGLSPSAGGVAGGTTVTITGTDLAGATAVTFGATPATSFVVNSGTTITAVAPAGTAGTVDLRVTSPAGTSVTNPGDQYTYTAAPTVTAISPTAGTPAGGTSVTITGTGFAGASAVSFGATPATSYTVNSSTGITAVAPAGVGTVDVTVTTVGGTSATSSADQFTYVLDQPPVFSAAAANSAQNITAGDGLTAVSASDADSDPLAYTLTSGALPTGISLQSSGGFSGTATTPGITSAGITVSDGRGGTALTTLVVHVAAPAPAVTGVSPSGGPMAGGTSVTITGTWLTGASVVHFGAIPATSFTVNSNTQITAVAPVGPASTVDITVTTGTGTSPTGSADHYAYAAPNVPPPPVVVNRPPVFTGAAGNTFQSVTVGAGLAAVAATDPDGDPVTYAVGSGTLPDGITLGSDGSLSGTTTTAGDTTATITASDGKGGAASTSLTVHVTAALSSVGNGTTPQKTSVPVPPGGSVNLVDGGSPTNQIKIDGQGTYTLDPATGVVTFAPVLGFAGHADPVTLVVTDGNGNTVTSHYTATVAAPAPPPNTPHATTGTSVQSTTVTLPAGGDITLLDARGNPATTVTVPGVGTYRLITSGAAAATVALRTIRAKGGQAVIEFTPATGYTGTAPAVTFRVTDAYGQQVTAAYTPTVTADATTPAQPTTPAEPVEPTEPVKPVPLPTTGSSALETAALGLLLIVAGLIAATRRRRLDG